MSFASSILRTLDRCRGIAGRMGLHPFQVMVRVNRWSGGVPGQGTKTVTDTPLLVNGDQNPIVRQVTEREAMLSGGVHSNQDFKIGPFTPPFDGGGLDFLTVDPSMVNGSELYFRITGPGLPAAGQWFEKVSKETDSALHLFIVVKAVAVTNP